MDKFRLGEKLRDSVSGFTGIAMSKVEFFNGCVRYCLEPTAVGKDGKLVEGQYFDQQQLVKVDDGLLKGNPIRATPTGGNPDRVPPKLKIPSR